MKFYVIKYECVCIYQVSYLMAQYYISFKRCDAEFAFSLFEKFNRLIRNK